LEIVWIAVCFSKIAHGQTDAPETMADGAATPEALTEDTAAPPTTAPPSVAPAESRPLPVEAPSQPVTPTPAELPPDDDAASERAEARRSAYRHDGFYMRVSAGIGGVWTKLETSAVDVPSSFDINGPALGFDLMLGGSPVPGLVVGGGFLFDQSPSPQVTSGDLSGTLDANLNFMVLGPFFDVFFDPKAGFHVGASVGRAVTTLSSEDGSTQAQAAGVGLAAFLGYDGFVSRQWSIGIFLRGMTANTSSSSDEVKEKLETKSFGVLLSALNH
jgi:hypothetical protein